MQKGQPRRTGASIIHPVTLAEAPHSGIDGTAVIQLSPQHASSFVKESVVAAGPFSWTAGEQTGKYQTVGLIMSACLWLAIVWVDWQWVGLIAAVLPADGLLQRLGGIVLLVRVIGCCLAVLFAHPPARDTEQPVSPNGRIVVRGGGFLVQKNFDIQTKKSAHAGYVVQRITKTHAIRNCATHAPRLATDASYFELFPVFATRKGQLTAESSDMFSADNHLHTRLFEVSLNCRLFIKYLFCQPSVVTEERALRDWWTDNACYGAVQINGWSWFWPLDQDCVRQCEAGTLSVIDATGQAYSMNRVPEANGLLASPHPPRDLFLPPDAAQLHSLTVLWNSDLQCPNQITLPSGHTHVLGPGNDFPTLIEHGLVQGTSV